MYPYCGFLGLNNLKAMQKADQEKLFPDLMCTRHEEMQAYTGRLCTTYKLHLMGQTILHTSDPKNVSIAFRRIAARY